MVRGRARSPKIGIFQAGTHDVVDIPRCRVHHPLVNDVGAALREAIRATGTRPYTERTHTGALRAVQIVVERASRTAQLVLVGNADDARTAHRAGGRPRRRTRRAPAQSLVERQPRAHQHHSRSPLETPERTRRGARVGVWGGRVLPAGRVRTEPPGTGRRAGRARPRLGARRRARGGVLRRLRPDRARAAAPRGARGRSSRAHPTPCAGSRWGSPRGPRPSSSARPSSPGARGRRSKRVTARRSYSSTRRGAASMRSSRRGSPRIRHRC